MKKLLVIVVCCLCLCGCKKENQIQTTVCLKSYNTLNMHSVEIYNSQNNNIISYSLGMVYSFETSEEVLEKENELLNIYKDKNLIQVDKTSVYEWSLKDVKQTGKLSDKINELQNNNYICETRDAK